MNMFKKPFFIVYFYIYSYASCNVMHFDFLILKELIFYPTFCFFDNYILLTIIPHYVLLSFCFVNIGDVSVSYAACVAFSDGI